MTAALKVQMKIVNDYLRENPCNSILLQFCKLFQIHYVFVALCICLISCEQNETFENNEFTTSVPKGARENNLSIGFNGFTYSYCFTTPDNQEIGIEIIPWSVDLTNLMNYYIDYKFPEEKKNKTRYFNSFNSFHWGLKTGIDCEIYKDDNLLDGWVYAFHTNNGESVCVYTLARSGHCRSIKGLIEDFNIKQLSKPTHSSLLAKCDSMIAAWLREQYNNSTIIFTQPESLIRSHDNFVHKRGTERGIMVIMNENKLENPLGVSFPKILHLNSYMLYIVNILNRSYLVNLRYPDDTIEAPWFMQ